MVVATRIAKTYNCTRGKSENIATYGGLVLLAKTIGENEVANILSQILEQEKDMDKRLTQIAENDINWQAQQEGEDSEEREDEE